MKECKLGIVVSNVRLGIDREGGQEVKWHGKLNGKYISADTSVDHYLLRALQDSSLTNNHLKEIAS